MSDRQAFYFRYHDSCIIQTSYTIDVCGTGGRFLAGGARGGILGSGTDSGSNWATRARRERSSLAKLREVVLRGRRRRCRLGARLRTRRPVGALRRILRHRLRRDADMSRANLLVCDHAPWVSSLFSSFRSAAASF